MEYKVFVVEDDDSIRGLYEIAFQDKFECKSFVNTALNSGKLSFSGI